MGVRTDSLAEIQKDTLSWCYGQKEFTVNELRCEFKSRLTKNQAYAIVQRMVGTGKAEIAGKIKNKFGPGRVNLYRFIGRVD